MALILEKLLSQGRGALPDSCLVGFEVARLKRARTVWVNRRWFAQMGLSLSEPGTVQKLGDELVRQFGYAIPGGESDAYLALDERQKWVTDRYGATGVSTNGGGGRTGIRGQVQIKGVGATPLVGRDTDWLHRDGILRLEEALREVVFSEIVGREFPHSSVPVLAVIVFDGETEVHDIGTQRALLVRPFVWRPAHFQRATFFVARKNQHEAQLADYCRTRDCIDSFCSSLGASNSHQAEILLEELARRAAEQVAHSHLFGFFNGGMFSSNFTVDGRLIDFGSARFVPSWENKPFADNDPRFGDELTTLKFVFETICYYFFKFGQISNVAKAHSRLCNKMDGSYESYINALVSRWSPQDEPGSEHSHDLTKLDDVQRRLAALNVGVLDRSIHYLTHGRCGLSREWVTSELANLFAGHAAADESFADELRIWLGLVVGQSQAAVRVILDGRSCMSHSTDGVSYAALLGEVGAGVGRAVIEGPVTDGLMDIFGHRTGTLRWESPFRSDSGVIELDYCCDDSGVFVSIDSRKIRLPFEHPRTRA